ncbi:23.5 kDa heat shock protein, mitochondrial-like [Cornus florida]|uniref:23.5 kDa heat shock protein, mitochondrial-like n=1 Tax=Cornus florida TaxID=4283 RepID=UPI0028A04A93|nr:23.5 kDa heat shock protein, mitochondrial-like [Cornus florida]
MALTSSSTLMNLLSPSVAAPVSVAIMKLLTPRIAAALSVRSFNTAVPLTNGPYSFSNNRHDSKQCPHGEDCTYVNRFLKEGSSIPYKVIKHTEGLYARLDMPGIGKEGLKLWIEDNSLHINGEEMAGSGSPRKYYGNINLPHGCYRVEEISAELKNGVLRVKIPKIKEEIDVRVNCSSCRRIHLIDVLPLLILAHLALK